MSSGASWLSSCKEEASTVKIDGMGGSFRQQAGHRILINTNHQELLPMSQL